jgi:hypothetical protein
MPAVRASKAGRRQRPDERGAFLSLARRIHEGWIRTLVVLPAADSASICGKLCS